MFSIWAKQQTIPSISASDSSKFQFHICFRSFRPDFLSVFHGEDTVPPRELRIDCKFQCQPAAKCALCSILSVCNNFVNCHAGLCLSLANSFFQMKNLNKLADVDVLVCDCNLLKDRWLLCWEPESAHANSHEKIGEWAHCWCCNVLLINHFWNIVPANLFNKACSS